MPKPPYRTVARRALSVCLAPFILVAPELRAQVEVDTELLLLIDVSGSVGKSEYERMAGAYGAAMTSAAVLESIQTGRHGKIAAAVAFFSSANRQAVGVGWMEISDLASARVFAERIMQAARPFRGSTAIAAALDFAVPLFGTETGGAQNGFRSLTQIIDITGDGTDNSSPPRVLDRSVNVMASRDRALRTGVDMINAIGLDTTPEQVSDYYGKFVIGGEAGGQSAFVRAVGDYGEFEAALAANLLAGIQAGSIASDPAAVPEPSTAILAGLGALTLLARRRRTHPGPRLP